MATITFDGTSDQTEAFDPAADTLVLNVAPADFANISDTSDATTDRVRFETTAGAVLVLTGVSLTDLTDDNVDVQGDGVIAVGDTQDGTTDNTINGTAFSDIIFGLTGNAINAGDGDNLIFGGDGSGDAGDDGDIITAGDGDDTVFGNGGVDTITTNGGNDFVYGGAGADTINVDPDAGDTATVYGGGGESDTNDDIDTITVGSSTATADGAANVFGNGGNDVLNIYADGDNRVEGGRGNDTILVNGDGDNTVRGGLGADGITVNGDGNNTVYGGSASASPDDGIDTITVNGEGNNTVYGNGDNDTITLNGADRVGINLGDAGDGDNQIFGGQGADTISLVGTDGTNTISGNLGADNIFAGVTSAAAFTAALAAAVASEAILGGDNTIYGGDDDTSSDDDGDTIYAAFDDGTSTIYGNGGSDTINVAALVDASVTVYGGQDDDDVTATANGSDATLAVYGNLGDDLLTVNTVAGGVATVYGGQGDDVIDGAVGVSADGVSQTVYGDMGEDSITLTGTGDAIVYGGTGQTDDAAEDDAITTGDGNDMLYGNGGDDTLTAGAGNDMLFGGQGDDTLNGDAGIDVLLGGDGDDDLIGGAGADVFSGGAGEDDLDFANGDVAGDVDEAHFSTTSSDDTITGFNLGADAVVDSDPGTPGDQPLPAVPEDFIAFLDGMTAGGVNFDETDGTVGPQGERFQADDVGRDYFEFDDNAGSALPNPAGFQATVSQTSQGATDLDAQAIASADNAVVVFNGFATAGGDIETFTQAGLTNSYVVITDGANTEIYFDADYANVDGRELVATIEGVIAENLDFDDFGIYA